MRVLRGLDDDYRLRALMMIQNDFQAKGQAGLDRLETDSLQHVCNKYSDKPPEALLRLVEADQLATVKYPADGRLMGDWREGEKVAQNGRGLQFSDAPGAPMYRR